MRIIVVTSGKGGVGKTTTAAHLGAALAARGKKVLLADMDMGLRNLDAALGLEGTASAHLLDVLNGKCSAEEAIAEAAGYPGLSFLAASPTAAEEELPGAKIRALMADLAGRFDMILADSPAGIGNGFASAVSAATEGIVVTTPAVNAVRDAGRVLELLEEAGIRNRFLLINRFRPDLASRGLIPDAGEIADLLGVPLIGVVPEDDMVLIGGNEGKVLTGTHTPAGEAYERIALRLLGEEVPLPSARRRKRLFSRRKRK